MFNYMNIEPSEFESICHEILEKITNQSFRVFGKGTDGGIYVFGTSDDRRNQSGTIFQRIWKAIGNGL